MTKWLLLGLCLCFSIPIWLGYTFLPIDLLTLIPPWQSANPSSGFHNHYYADAVAEHLPWKIFLSDQLKQGIFPLWNPYNFNGTPFLALSTPQILDPLNIFYLFLTPQLAFDMTLIIKIFLAGFFMSLLLRHYGVDEMASAIGSLAYSLNGAFLMNIHFGWMLGAFVWIPLVFLFLEKAQESKNLRDMALASLFLSFSYLAGNIQIILHILILLFLWGSYHLYEDWRLRKREKALLFTPACLVGVIFLATLMGSVSLLPTAELMSFGFSRRDTYSALAWFSNFGNNLLKVPFLLSFLVPNFFGHHSIFSPVLMTGWKWSDFVQGYIGFVPLMLAIFAVGARKDFATRKFRFIGFASLGLLFLSPAIEWLYSRALIVWCFAASVLAGLGASYLWKANKYYVVKLRRASGYLLIFLLGGLWIVHIFIRLFKGDLIQYWDSVTQTKMLDTLYVSLIPFYLEKVRLTFDYYRFSNPYLIMTLGIIGFFYFALRSLLSKKWSVAWTQKILLVLVLFDVVYFASLYTPVVSRKQYPLYPETPAIRFLKQDKEVFRVMPMQRVGRDNPPFFHEANIPADIQVPIGTGSLNYYPAIRYSLAFQHNESVKLPFNRELANLANVKYFVTGSFPFEKLGYPLVYDGEIKIYKNPNVLPRVYFPPRFEIASDDEAFSRFKDPHFKTAKLFFLDRMPVDFPDQQGKGYHKETIVQYQSNLVAIDVETENDQMLVLLDTYYPGWKAYVDGGKIPIYRANTIFRAVHVPAGEHKVEFRYQPLSFRIGLWLSVIGYLFALIVVGRSCFVRRPFKST